MTGPETSSANPPTFAFLVNELARMLAVIYGRRMEHMQLTRAQWEVLGYVARWPGVYQGELAELIGVGRMTITGLLDRLESKALIERQPDPNDRRVKRVFLTQQAVEHIPDLQRVADELMDQVQDSLSQAERKKLVALLSKVHCNAARLIQDDAN